MVRRKDSRGRVLNDGETQGKDGRYRYQYMDVLGERKATDKLITKIIYFIVFLKIYLFNLTQI